MAYAVGGRRLIPIRVAKVLTLTILILTLFTNVTKGAFGTQANLVVDFVSFVAVILILQINKIHYTRLIALWLAYIFLHAIIQLLIHGGLLSGNHYTDYRNLLRGGVIFILLLNSNFKSAAQVDSFFKFIFIVVGSLALVNIYAELIAVRILGFDLRSLPYVEAAYGDVITTYGTPEHRERIPTLLGSPHFFGLTQASLVFVFWHLYKQGYSSRVLVYLTLVSVLFLSRLQVLVVFSIIFAYYFRGFRGFRTSSRGMFLLLSSAIALVIVVNEFGYALILTGNPKVLLAYDSLINYRSLEPLLELSIFPDFEDLYKIIFGVGGVTGNAQYGNIISLAEIEVGLIVELIPKYGMVFVVLYYAFLWRIFVRLRGGGNKVLAFALIPFMASPLHMWTVNSTFVSDMFFIILAYCHLLLRAFDREYLCTLTKRTPKTGQLNKV
ncbi:hypothetical protein MYX84_01295 [Acidobacteria bacterium AH-259-O06]|nr:hypothetical protein [Acidobacteria bacterium AH-259-O06]